MDFVSSDRLRRSFNAFTILELLVVIGITGILVALLVPVTGTLRESARSTKCLANLRQIATAATMYSGDNDGYLVPMYYPTELPDPLASRYWTGALAGYLGRKESGWFSSYQDMPVFFCPSRPGVWGYGYNYYGLSPFTSPKNPGDPTALLIKRSAVARPSRTVMFVDSHVPKGLEWRPFVRYPTYATDRWSSEPPGPFTISFRHRGSCNVAWVDGHVSSEKPYTEFTDSDALWKTQ